MEGVYTLLHPTLLMALRREYKPCTPGGETEAQAGNVTCPGHKGGEGSEQDQVESLRVSTHPSSGSHWSIRVPALHSFIHLLAWLLKYSESAYSVSCTLLGTGDKRNQAPTSPSRRRRQQGWANRKRAICILEKPGHPAHLSNVDSNSKGLH